jgi:hypothetical protein
MIAIRLIVLSAMLAATTVTSPAFARPPGTFSLSGDRDAQQWCIANLRRARGNNTWDYHSIMTNTEQSCNGMVQEYINSNPGYSYNPGPGIATCSCRKSIGPLMPFSDASGPLAAGGLSLDAIEVYNKGFFELQKRYRFKNMMREHDNLLKRVEAIDGKSMRSTEFSPDGNGKRLPAATPDVPGN